MGKYGSAMSNYGNPPNPGYCDPYFFINKNAKIIFREIGTVFAYNNDVPFGYGNRYEKENSLH